MDVTIDVMMMNLINYWVQFNSIAGTPYCFIPCYGALFGPQLYGHGSRVESHKSFGKPKMSAPPGVDRHVLEQKLKEYNLYFEENMPSSVIQCRERNGKLIMEGSLRVFWDIANNLHLKVSCVLRFLLCS